MAAFIYDPLVAVGVAVNAPTTERSAINQILDWIGFSTQEDRTAIINDAFIDFEDLKKTTEKEITKLEDSFTKKVTANRIYFGARKTKKLKALVHWVQDFYRISLTPTIEGLTDNAMNIALTTAAERAEVRKRMDSISDAASKVANPGPLISEAKWPEWEPKFVNYMSTMLGIDGIPLSYVIREDDAPDQTGPHPDFVDQCVACAPLTGVAYEADRSTVHQALVSFTTGQPSEDWMKPTNRYKDGRRSMKALRDHFSGEGNTIRRVAEAERLSTTLHYKNERSLAFETFLTKCQKMYNIFEKSGEPMTEDAKIRFLFNKVQHSGLQSTVDALKARITTSPVGTITYTTVANHLSTAVSELPEYVSRHRNISATGTSPRGGGGGQEGSVYNSDGSIITGYINNWRELSREDKQVVLDERARLGIKKKSNNKNGKSKTEMEKLKKLNAKMKRRIKALKRVKTSKNKGEDGDDEDDIDAGDQFGGKNSKKTKRN